MHIMEFVKIITYETVALGGQRAHNEWMIKYLRFPTLTHRTHLLNYLRFYWTTWEFTELPQNLLNYLTIYWTTWEFTELPHNLLNYLRIYWTTSQFTELPQIFTELPQIFTELPGFLQVKIIELPGPAEVYYSRWSLLFITFGEEEQDMQMESSW